MRSQAATITCIYNIVFNLHARGVKASPAFYPPIDKYSFIQRTSADWECKAKPDYCEITRELNLNNAYTFLRSFLTFCYHHGKESFGFALCKEDEGSCMNNMQTLDSAGVPSINTPDIPPDPGETDDPNTSPGPPGDLDAPGPSQSMTMVVPAVVAPLPLEEDPPDAPVGPDLFADVPGSPDPLRLGEALGLGDGPDNSVEVVDVGGTKPRAKTPGSSNDQHDELMMMLRSIDQWLTCHDEAIEDLQAWIYRPSPGLAGSQIPLNSPQFEATSVPPPVPVRGRDREPIQRRNSLVDEVSADKDYVRTTTYLPVPGHPSSIPAPEAPVILESSTDKGETDRDPSLTRNLHHGSGPALVMNTQGEIKKKQRTIFAPHAPSEMSVEYGTQMDGDAVYMHRPEGLDNHAWEIRRPTKWGP
ncbi:uncharacterized protein EI90DRAFT_3018710 [Cantharellus anzutake]|uniref:uncharacterized protein n=1 Tax=Cantharellus anzutake TaxID=1750568 RepID=UPI0019089FA8|nr:uncharacterized protein EI90DRAFT_3018710 [Cantharellus anzutake]KAF8326196.1 hypothetical protein EI90DRAFT_3018710 [Cantharellus anzutake]